MIATRSQLSDVQRGRQTRCIRIVARPYAHGHPAPTQKAFPPRCGQVRSPFNLRPSAVVERARRCIALHPVRPSAECVSNSGQRAIEERERLACLSSGRERERGGRGRKRVWELVVGQHKGEREGGSRTRVYGHGRHMPPGGRRPRLLTPNAEQRVHPAAKVSSLTSLSPAFFRPSRGRLRFTQYILKQTTARERLVFLLSR